MKQPLFSIEGTLYCCAWHMDCLPYDNTHSCNCFPHLQWEDCATFLWFVYLQGFLVHSKALQKSSLSNQLLQASRCCLMLWSHNRQVRAPGIGSLMADGRVSFMLGSLPQRKVESHSPPSSLDAYTFAWLFPRSSRSSHTPALRSKWKEIMSFVRATIERQCFVGKEKFMAISLQPRLITPALAGGFPDLWGAGVLFTLLKTENCISYSFLSATCLKYINVIFTNIGILEIFQGATFQ